MSFLAGMGETMRCYAQFRAGRLEQYGVVGYQYLYITTLCRNPGMSQDELAEKLIFNKSSVARQVAALEEKGFVTRRRNEKDKREMLVYPTEKAQEVFPAIQKVIKEFREHLTSEMAPEDRKAFEDQLAVIQEKAKAALEEK